jgi:rhodanese-related sulfurtransferase
MNADTTISLSELLAARDDPRLCVLDIRAPAIRASQPLENAFLPVVYAPGGELRVRLLSFAALLGNRHVVVIDDDQATAAQASRLLQSVEVEAVALEGGVEGWLDAIARLSLPP